MDITNSLARRLVDGLFVFVGVLTPNGALVEVNQAVLDAATLERQDVLGKPFEDTYWWSYSSAAQKELREAIDRACRGEPVRYEALMRVGETRFTFVDFAIAPLFDDAGSVHYLIPSAVDITQRKLAEETVQRDEERLRRLAQIVSEAVWFNRDGRAEDTDNFWLNLTGQPLEEALSGGWLTVVHPADRDRVNAAWQHSIVTQAMFDVEYRVEALDGTYHWIVSKGAPLKNDDGTIREWVGTFEDVTERRRAEAALGESERFLTSIVNAMPGLIYIYDVNENRNVYVNDQLGPLFGYTFAEAHEDGFLSRLAHPDDLDIIWEQVERMRSAREGEALEASYRLQHKSGEWRWVYARETVFKRDADGSVAQVLGIAEDITARKAAEEALQRANVLFEQAEAAAGGFVYEWDTRTNAVQRSPGVKAILGYESDEIDDTAKGWRSLIHPEDLAHLERIRTSVLATRDQVNSEYRIRHKDGHYVWVWERGIIQRDEHGQAVRVVGSTVDITERKQAEEAVRQSERRFRALRDANIIGIIYTNFDGRIIEANDAFLRLLGFTRDDLNAGRIDWRKLTPPEWHELDVEALAALRDTGRAAPWEKEYYRKDGRRVPVLVGASLMNDQTKDVMAFILDISERKKLEQRKDDFIALASHELKTPITSLKTYTQVLRRRFEDSGEESAVRLVTRMETQINRLVEVVQDLLDVAKIQEGKLALVPSPFAMDDLVREIVGELQPITAHELRVEDDAGEPIVADRERIRQVLINLIFNAVTYSPKTQPVTLRTWRDDEGTHVSVIDHGVGIPKSEQTRIFDRFYQTESSSGKTYPGLGLGLFISAEIMKRHAGSLTVESEVGAGSTFTLTLPHTPATQGAQADG